MLSDGCGTGFGGVGVVADMEVFVVVEAAADVVGGHALEGGVRGGGALGDAHAFLLGDWSGTIWGTVVK